ncbi:CvfB family protein [Robertkochia aurantiaca]|uniref:CvfB family protein n=1 Tax=Robertkochia aurantiaca TaxID=2873700 RepID=UPI001CCEDBF0|nr:S1-like domain-containing RNA-binding protein [Robertkochia sp. 3YJGBD-33]
MIKTGSYNTLTIDRHTSVGLFLTDEEGNDILLPNKYVPEDYELGDKMTVFCYLDHDERPVATTLKPAITLGEFGLLKVADVSQIGAFMNWGLEKHLFVPFREQARKMEEGKHYLVYLYEDEKTGRLVGSSKTDRFLSNDEVTVDENQEVDLIVKRFTDLGVEVIINNRHKGLVYQDEIFRKLHLGEHLKGYIKKIREDNKIDVALQVQGVRNLEPSAEKVLKTLKDNGGYLPLHDKSDPETISRELQMSKKSFKKAVGILYKKRRITIEEGGIRLIES